jgi:stage III sporulation protein AB
MGAGLVIAGGAAVGWATAGEMKQRTLELKELCHMMDILEGEIRCTHVVLAEAFLHTADKISRPFSDFLRKTGEHMNQLPEQTFGELFAGHVREDLKKTALSECDKQELIRFGEQFGAIDLKMQLTAMELFREQLGQTYAQAQKEYERSAGMYQKLGLFGGLFLAVLLI